ncbi:DNA modification methylase [Bifidobacterium breve]|jgi:site-specific DNA-methyltransferase (adenine-specific)|uniref:Methyltransferase n=3 Tax=root TaxID=1 RepID=A0AAW7LDW3_BIFBR|nr:DNA modification methylase [Bifidobacterium breve]MDN4187327.1 DNA modification methylase [Bifidobacterium breve]DAQ98580.1 MAG TPA: adenine specific DNA methyltransferase [Caudoviricetes sp.]
MPNLKVETFKISDLSTYHKNPRRGDVDAIAESLKARGQYRPIVVNIGTHASHDYEILAGNHTYLAAKKLGWKTIQATTVDVDDDQAAQIVLADNRLADLGGYDDETLSALLSDVSSLDGLGWSQDDVDELAAALEPERDDSEVEDVEVPDDAPQRVKRGEIWVLGEHRLMCGDSTKPEDMRKLLGGGEADLWLTDPPYNVAIVGKTKKHLTIENDSWANDDEFVEFLRKAFVTALDVLKPGCAFYVWFAQTQAENFLAAADKAGMTIRQTLIWAKSTFSLGRQDYQWKHEPCLYGWKDGASHRWFSDRKQTTVLEFEKPARNAEHPTMKPVPLMAYEIRNSSRVGDTVLDSFGGSGSTLMACEQTGRKCVTMELDPHYCDVILKRWEDYTGQKAERISE